jgi:hypothetical protein
MFRSSNENTDVLALVELFNTTPRADIVTFDDMSKRLGYNIRRRLHVVQAARKRYEKEGKVALINVRGVGYAYADANQTLDTYPAARKTARLKLVRNNKRALNALSASNDLTVDQQKRFYREAAVAGALSMQLEDRNVAKVNVDETTPLSRSEIVKRSLEMWNKA